MKMGNAVKKIDTEVKPVLSLIKNDISKVAFMDLDGTILDSHCVNYLNLIHKGLNGKINHLLYTTALRLKGVLFHLLNHISSSVFDKYYYNHYKGIKANEIDSAIKNKVLPFIKKKIFPQAIKEIERLRSEGYYIVLVSGTLRNIVRPLVSELKVHDCISTELEVKGGVFTGRVDGYFVNNLNKRKAIEEYCEERNLSPDKIVAYGNSKWDIPMLEMADEVYIVNPDKKLTNWSKNKVSNKNSWSLGKIPWENYLMYALLFPYLRKWEGAEHIPNNKGAILIANHSSYLDHYIIGLFVSFHCKRRVRYLAKKEHFDTPFQKWIHETLGAVPIDRDKGGKEGLKVVVDLLKNNEIVLMYPEGTRSRDGLMQDFKPGVLFTHIKGGCDIIPAGLNGAFQVLPSGKLFPGFSRISLKFGAPVSFIGNVNKETLPRGNERKALLNGLHNTVKNLAEGIYAV